MASNQNFKHYLFSKNHLFAIHVHDEHIDCEHCALLSL